MKFEFCILMDISTFKSHSKGEKMTKTPILTCIRDTYKHQSKLNNNLTLKSDI